jgi:hypothetical protein
MRKPLIVLPTALAIGLVGCVATMPIGPTARVMPAPNKPFEVFVHEEGRCRDYAYQRAGGVEAGEAAARSGLASAAVGTAVGAAVGALAGGGRGAGVGAAGGLGNCSAGMTSPMSNACTRRATRCQAIARRITCRRHGPRAGLSGRHCVPVVD